MRLRTRDGESERIHGKGTRENRMHSCQIEYYFLVFHPILRLSWVLFLSCFKTMVANREKRNFSGSKIVATVLVLVFSLNLSKVVGHVKHDMLQLGSQTIEFRELKSNHRKLDIKPIWFLSSLFAYKFKENTRFLGITYLISFPFPL